MTPPNEITDIRVALRDMMIDLLSTPNAPAMSHELATQFMQQWMLAHGWLMREGAFAIAHTGLQLPNTTMAPVEYLGTLKDVAIQERKEALARLREMAVIVNKFINPPEGKYLN